MYRQLIMVPRDLRCAPNLQFVEPQPEVPEPSHRPPSFFVMIPYPLHVISKELSGKNTKKSVRCKLNIVILCNQTLGENF